MYSRTAHFGKNGVFCTLQDGKALSRSTFSEYLARKVWFSCPSVHNARFLPFCDVLPPVRVLWVLGATGSYPLEEIFPRVGALGTLGVDGAVAAAISEPLMRGVFPGVGGMVAATAFKSPVQGCVWPLDLPALVPFS